MLSTTPCSRIKNDLCWLRWSTATMVFHSAVIQICESSISPIQLSIHCLAWNANVILANLQSTDQAMRCPKLLLMAKHICRIISCTVYLSSAAYSATRDIETPCINLKNVTTIFFSTAIDCLQCVCCPCMNGWRLCTNLLKIFLLIRKMS